MFLSHLIWNSFVAQLMDVMLSCCDAAGDNSKSWCQVAYLWSNTSWHTTPNVARCTFHDNVRGSENSLIMLFIHFVDKIKRQQPGEKKKKRSTAVTAPERRVGVFTNCHSKVNVSPSANWLPHHSIHLLEATAIKLSARWQFSLPIWQHVVIDRNTDKQDKTDTIYSGLFHFSASPASQQQVAHDLPHVKELCFPSSAQLCSVLFSSSQAMIG